MGRQGSLKSNSARRARLVPTFREGSIASSAASEKRREWCAFLERRKDRRRQGSERLIDLDCSLADSAVYLYRRTSLTRVDRSSWSRHAFGLPGMQTVTSLTRIAPT